jgi:F-type H+-transporting ATPase subunit delta
MKKSLDRLAEISAEKLNDKNYPELAHALWFELNKSKRVSSTDVLIDKIRKIYEARQDRLVAKIISTDDLSADQLELIKTKLEKKYNSKFYLETAIDKSLIGGIKIQINDEVIDLSWQGQLSQLKERLAGEDE